MSRLTAKYNLLKYESSIMKYQGHEVIVLHRVVHGIGSPDHPDAIVFGW